MESLTVDDQLFAAARNGDVKGLTVLLDAQPTRLHARAKPYQWTLLHTAAHRGQLPVVDLLLERGLDVNSRENGDNTVAMHWAAAAGHLDVVQRLADAGGDVVGHGDDHELEIIGWATCWEGCDDDAHRAIVDVLVGRGAQHHIFSAIAVGLADEVRRIVAADPAALHTPMSRNEDFQRPLHFAVRKNRAEMVSLLLELGADPAVTDGSGAPAAAYAADPGVDRRVIETLARSGPVDLFIALSLGDEARAARLVEENPAILARDAATAGVLHLTAKRGDASAVRWLLAHGAEPNTRWSHWGGVVTPLHFAAMKGHADVVRELLDAGADPHIRDSMHDGDAMGWAQHGGHPEIVGMLEAHARRS